MVYVVDTHSLIWYLTANKSLSTKVKKIIEEAERGRIKLVVPLIILFESLVLIEKKRIKTTWQKFWQNLKKFPKISFYPIDLEVFQEGSKVSRRLELHDRIIVATARLLKARLISKDEDIKKYGKVEVVW